MRGEPVCACACACACAGASALQPPRTCWLFPQPPPPPLLSPHLSPPLQELMYTLYRFVQTNENCRVLPKVNIEPLSPSSLPLHLKDTSTRIPPYCLVSHICGAFRREKVPAGDGRKPGCAVTVQGKPRPLHTATPARPRASGAQRSGSGRSVDHLPLERSGENWECGADGRGEGWDLNQPTSKSEEKAFAHLGTQARCQMLSSGTGCPSTETMCPGQPGVPRRRPRDSLGYREGGPGTARSTTKAAPGSLEYHEGSSRTLRKVWLSCV